MNTYNDPQFSSHLERARSYRANNLLDNAIAELNQAIGLQPSHPDALVELAQAHLTRFHKNDAISDLDRAERGANMCLLLHPGHPAAHAILTEAQHIRTERNLAPAVAEKQAQNLRVIVAVVLAIVLLMIGAIVSFLATAPA